MKDLWEGILGILALAFIFLGVVVVFALAFKIIVILVRILGG